MIRNVGMAFAMLTFYGVKVAMGYAIYEVKAIADCDSEVKMEDYIDKGERS